MRPLLAPHTIETAPKGAFLYGIIARYARIVKTAFGFEGRIFEGV